MMVKFKQIIIPLVVLILASIVISFLIPSYHPFGALKITNNKLSISNQAEAYLKKAKVSYDENSLNIAFESDNNFVRWINSPRRWFGLLLGC